MTKKDRAQPMSLGGGAGRRRGWMASRRSMRLRRQTRPPLWPRLVKVKAASVHHHLATNNEHRKSSPTPYKGPPPPPHKECLQHRLHDNEPRDSLITAARACCTAAGPSRPLASRTLALSRSTPESLLDLDVWSLIPRDCPRSLELRTAIPRSPRTAAPTSPPRDDRALVRASHQGTHPQYHRHGWPDVLSQAWADALCRLHR